MIVPQSGSCEGHRPTTVGQPVWDLATFFPAQGSWTVADYLGLQSNRLVEFTDGIVEVLPMPTLFHQLIVKVLAQRLDHFVAGRGIVAFAPLPIWLRAEMYREPDLVYLSPERAKRTDQYPAGADLVMEVVSEGREARARDYDRKRQEYAQYGIAEYWIVDPELRTITVLGLDKAQGQYTELGVYRSGETACSALLAGFEAPVNEVFAPLSGHN